MRWVQDNYINLACELCFSNSKNVLGFTNGHIVGMLPEFRIKGTETSLDHVCNDMVYANKNLVVI